MYVQIQQVMWSITKRKSGIYLCKQMDLTQNDKMCLVQKPSQLTYRVNRDKLGAGGLYVIGTLFFILEVVTDCPYNQCI